MPSTSGITWLWLPARGLAIHAGYDVAPDGRLLIVRLDPRAIPTHINVVLNWFPELRAKLAGAAP